MRIYENSKVLYERAKQTMSGGLHSNGRNRTPFPIYFQKTQDAYAIDVDGNVFIDLIMGNGTMILGHNNPEFKEHFDKYMAANGGLCTGFDSRLSVEVAERFKAITGHERVRFTNTGTEAITHVMHIARVCTGRPNVAVMEGAYNGWTDAIYVNSFAPLDQVGPAERPNPVPGTGGLDERIVRNTVVLPFNNIEASEVLIREHKDDLAAIILEPVMIDIGFVPATQEYINFLRRICDELGILLVFDELLAGFRVSYGGCQELYGVKSDLAIFGKAFANGFIIAAVAGKAEFMDASAPGGKTAFIGTFNGHQYSMCAAAATFDLIESGEVLRSINASWAKLRDGFNSLVAKHGIAACINGSGGHFQVYFRKDLPTNYREAADTDRLKYTKYVNAMQENGCWCSQNSLSHHVLSVKHDEAVIDQVLDAMDKSLQIAAE